MKRELLKVREAAEKMRENGKDIEAAEAERRVEKLEAELALQEGDQGAEFEGRVPHSPREDLQPPFEGADLERRLRHLKVAIDHLHAAGMHEPAERLAQKGERMRQELAEQNRAGLHGPMPLELEIEAAARRTAGTPADGGRVEEPC